MAFNQDRFYTNTLADYRGEPSSFYLDTNGRLKTEFASQIWEYLNSYAINKLNRHVPDNLNLSDSSVYHGTSGMVLAFLKLYDLTMDKAYFYRAISLNEIALKHLKSNNSSPTFLFGNNGSFAVAALVAHLQNDLAKRDYFVKIIKDGSRVVLDSGSGIPDEILYGRAGYLYTLLFIRKKIDKTLIEDSLIENVFRAIIQSGRSLASHNNKPPLMFEWHGSRYIGAAHGISGILYTLLRAMSEVPDLFVEGLDTDILPTIEYLRKCKHSSGNYESSIGSTTDKLVQWCHGSPGLEYLFNMAYKITNSQAYLDEVKKCGEITWSRGVLKKGYGLCHGVAGNAYTFLDSYNLTDDPLWLHRAWMFAKWCIDFKQREKPTPDRPYSLYEGLSGTIYFMLDMLDPKHAEFPAFQI